MKVPAPKAHASPFPTCCLVWSSWRKLQILPPVKLTPHELQLLFPSKKQPVSICKAYRVGSYTSSPAKAPKPLKVIFGTIAQQRLLMSRKVDIAERNPTVFSPQLFQGGADKAPGSQNRTSATFIAGRNGPQNQEWADHLKATCPENFSLANPSSAIGPSNCVGGQSAIRVPLANCCSLYHKLAEHNLLCLPMSRQSLL